MMTPGSIAVTGLVSAARHRFLCPPAGAAMAQGLADALSGAGIAPDGMSAHAGAGVPSWPAPAAPDGHDGALCALPGMLWALEDAAAAWPGVLFVVCYEAPWLALDALLAQAPERFLAHPRAALDLWRSYYREALRLRTVLGPRMVLVNAGFTGGGDAQLLAYLREQNIVLERAAPGPTEPPDQPGWASARARLLDLAAPDIWDLYESLESCALLLGRAPQFRQTLSAPTDADADALLQQWSTAHGERLARAGLAAVQRELDAAREAGARRAGILDAELGAERAHILSLREALLAQSQDFAAARSGLEESASSAAAAAEQALHAAADDLRAARAELATVREELLVQGRDCAMQCRAIEHSAQAAERAAAYELTVARGELARVRASLLAETETLAGQCRAVELGAAAAAGAAAQEIAALRAELASMLEALHATQETLEHSYAESEALCATATSANALLRQAWLLVAAAAHKPGSPAMAQATP